VRRSGVWGLFDTPAFIASDMLKFEMACCKSLKPTPPSSSLLPFTGACAFIWIIEARGVM
jgi:hypothetical protein